jgi:hypothetical protein
MEISPMAKFQQVRWRKYNGHSPIGEILEDVITKFQYPENR